MRDRVTPEPMDTPADNATAPAPYPESPSAVTEEGRSWTIFVCPECDVAAFKFIDGAEHWVCGNGHRVIRSSVKVVEAGAVEAELGRLEDALREIEALPGGTHVYHEDGDYSYMLDGHLKAVAIAREVLASSPGREGRDGGTDEG